MSTGVVVLCCSGVEEVVGPDCITVASEEDPGLDCPTVEGLPSS